MLAMRSSRKTPVKKLETQGILLIVLVIVVYTLARYWHNISWSLR
jgi:t-SNARE complex subunit (syntaxin)